MKKLLSFLLTLAIISGCFTAFCGIVNAEDTQDGPLYFNDFENCTFPGTAYFSVTDTGDGSLW